MLGLSFGGFSIAFGDLLYPGEIATILGLSAFALIAGVQVFENAGLPYYHPHTFRKTIATLGEKVCRTPEEFKAWSQNLAHENVLTTFTSYGMVSGQRQAEILGKLREADGGDDAANPDQKTIQSVIAYLQKKAS